MRFSPKQIVWSALILFLPAYCIAWPLVTHDWKYQTDPEIRKKMGDTDQTPLSELLTGKWEKVCFIHEYNYVGESLGKHGYNEENLEILPENMFIDEGDWAMVFVNKTQARIVGPINWTEYRIPFDEMTKCVPYEGTTMSHSDKLTIQY